MTTVRGKDRLRVTSTPEVEAQVHGQTVRITAFGWDGKQGSLRARFAIEGEMSVHCTVRLIRHLRIALRAIRDHQVKTLNNSVTEAEGPL